MTEIEQYPSEQCSRCPAFKHYMEHATESTLRFGDDDEVKLIRINYSCHVYPVSYPEEGIRETNIATLGGHGLYNVTCRDGFSFSATDYPYERDYDEIPDSCPQIRQGENK